MQLKLANEHQSKVFASAIAKALHPPLVLTFSGEIGTGKTTFIRFILKAFGVTSTIKSPTFSLVESYQYGDNNLYQIHHFDFYRIHDEEELEYIGFRDYLHDNVICCIEWPERVSQSLIQADLHFDFTIDGSGRLLKIEALSSVGKSLMLSFSGRS